MVLEKEEAEHLNKILQDLPISSKSLPVDGLDYRVFMVTVNEKETYRIYATVVLKETEPKQILLDKNNVEQLLLKMASQKGYGSILESLGVE